MACCGSDTEREQWPYAGTIARLMRNNQLGETMQLKYVGDKARQSFGGPRKTESRYVFGTALGHQILNVLPQDVPFFLGLKATPENGLKEDLPAHKTAVDADGKPLFEEATEKQWEAYQKKATKAAAATPAAKAAAANEAALANAKALEAEKRKTAELEAKLKALEEEKANS